MTVGLALRANPRAPFFSARVHGSPRLSDCQVLVPAEHGRPSRRRVFPRIVREQLKIRSVGPDDGDVAVRLRVVRVERHLIAECGLPGGKGDPRAIGRPRWMRVVAGNPRDAPQTGTIRPNRVDLPVVVLSIAGERDLIALRRPRGKVVVLSLSVSQHRDATAVDVQYPKALAAIILRAENDPSAVG